MDICSVDYSIFFFFSLKKYYTSYFQRIIYYLISMGMGILFDETALNKYKMLNGQQRKTYKDLLIFPLRDFLSYPDAETSVNYELCSRNAAISCFPQLKLIA